jgi:hypothetical protein
MVFAIKYCFSTFIRNIISNVSQIHTIYVDRQETFHNDVNKFRHTVFL